MKLDFNTLGIDIGSTTVKIAILNKDGEIIFSDYQRHYANIQETLAKIIDEAYEEFGDIPVSPMITGSGGLTLCQAYGSSIYTGGSSRRLHALQGLCSTVLMLQ